MSTEVGNEVANDKVETRGRPSRKAAENASKQIANHANSNTNHNDGEPKVKRGIITFTY
jgi:hypothetical protein